MRMMVAREQQASSSALGDVLGELKRLLTTQPRLNSFFLPIPLPANPRAPSPSAVSC
ncbi:hypothetical protein B0T16DRAFT_405372 [Cercophora newfieldiana]|uniref:Uncharacterized protein n=1 Tax=Cercophora newfieldiana TaxID=92897 RepID=A0AA40CWU1_9PEZI|nr:hypothetical protein B0T16DRAFT_405372 [Cercophora newfieldiana]